MPDVAVRSIDPLPDVSCLLLLAGGPSVSRETLTQVTVNGTMGTMKTDTEVPVSGQLLNSSTVRGVMVEAGASVRQVNSSLEHWPVDGDPAKIGEAMVATGLRRLQIKVIVHTLREVASILDIGTRNGSQGTADRGWTPVPPGQPADKDPEQVGLGIA